MRKRNRTTEEILAERGKIKKEYGRLFEAVSEILFRHDPAELNFGFNENEYEPEAETILPRLRNCQSTQDVLLIVREEFQRWFGKETASKEENNKIAEEIWNLWRNRKFILPTKND